METPLPNPDKFQSLNVNESRAKRLERQHARMRDRGGIFRPENNNNLFDLLRTATHRKSPAKGRSRSRSRSNSPLKKITISANSPKPVGNKKPARKPTARKSNATLAPVAEVAEVETELQDHGLGGKQRVSETQDDTEQPKAKARAKKPSTAKKTTTKKPRRTTKESTPAGESVDECANKTTKQTKPKPRGRRKKQDVEPTVSKNLSPDPAIANKDISNPSTTTDIVPEKATTKSRTKRPTSKIQRQPVDQPVGADESNDPLDESLKLPPKTNARKRKVENLKTDDEPRPLEVLKPHSKSQKSKSSSSECKSGLKDLPEVDLTCKALEEVHANKPCNPAKKPKLSTKSKLNESVDLVENLDIRVEKTESKATSKTTTKRSRLPAEDETEPAMKVKKTKIDPSTEVAAPQKPDSSRSRSTDKSNDTGRKRRKENTTSTGKSRGGKGSRAKKQGSGLPAHIRQKLKAQRHEKHTSDDEPDPIDFLS